MMEREVFGNAAASRQCALVTGGTGLIGTALCAYLIQQGYDVLVLTRNRQSTDKASQTKNHIRFIDSLDRIAETDKIDAIINLAGESINQRWTKAVKQRLIDSRLGITRQLITLIERLHTKPRVLLSGSAIGVYGTSDTMVFTEDTAPSVAVTGAFSHSLCTQWEAMALQANTYGVRTCLLRTGVVLSPKGGALGAMLLPFKLGLGGPIGSGQQWFSWIHIEDMIALIAYVLAHPVSGAVNATAPHPVTNRIFAQTLGRTLKRPSVLTMPAFVVNILFGTMGQELLLSGQHVVPTRMLELGFKFTYPQLDQALQQLMGAHR
jgi:uncharacterized protein (TIGR01777 family)